MSSDVSPARSRRQRRYPRIGRCVFESERAPIEALLFSDGPGQLVPYFYRVATLTGLSAGIAALGLIESSTAVVIGAMLVSPLMQPMIGIASALVTVNRRRQLVSVGLIAFAAAESVGVAALIAALAPSFHAVTITPEMLLRTSPGILDLAIACAAGAAGAYVTVRPQAAAALPGAAIAVALMPPLATLGILVERGNSHLAAGALLLFVTNLLGIIVASAAVLLITGFGAHRSLTKREQLTVLIPLVTALAIAYPLYRVSASSYRNAKTEALVRPLIVPQLRSEGLGIQNLAIIDKHGQLTVSIDVTGPAQTTIASSLSRQLANTTRRPATLIVRWTKRNEITAVGAPTSR